jgi:ankyrin repeat protein
MVGFIARLHPTINRQCTMIELFNPSSDSLLKKSTKAPWLKTLLQLGVQLDFIIQLPDGDRSITDCIVGNKLPLDTHDRIACLDVLLSSGRLNHWHEERWSNFFEQAVSHSTLPIISRLLDHRKYPLTYMTAVLDLIRINTKKYPDRAWQCLVFEKLIDHGAQVSEAFLKCCALDDVDWLYVFLKKKVPLSFDCAAELCVRILTQQKSEVTQCCLEKIIERYPYCLFLQDLLEKIFLKYRCFCIEKLFEQPENLAQWRSKSGISALHLFAAHNQASLMQRLIETKLIGINVRDSSGKPPLHFAVIRGAITAARYLLSQGAEYQSLAPRFYKFLHTTYKSKYKKIDAMRNLCCSDPDWAHVFAPDFRIRLQNLLVRPVTGTLHAAEGKRFLKFAESKMFECDTKLLAYALFNLMKIAYPDPQKDPDWFTKYLIQRTPWLIHLSDYQGDTMLHHAARFDKKELIQHLLSHTRIDRNVVNKSGNTYRDLVKMEWYPGICVRVDPKVENRVIPIRALFIVPAGSGYESDD